MAMSDGMHENLLKSFREGPDRPLTLILDSSTVSNFANFIYQNKLLFYNLHFPILGQRKV